MLASALALSSTVPPATTSYPAGRLDLKAVTSEANNKTAPFASRRYVLAFFQKLPPCLVGIEACASSPLVAPNSRCWATP